MKIIKVNPCANGALVDAIEDDDGIVIFHNNLAMGWIDAAPIVHAHWVHIDGTGYCKCSNCRKPPKVIGTIQYSEFKFCPNCGSQMDGDKHE